MANSNSYITINWNDGSDDNFYFNLTKLDSDNEIEVSSDENNTGVSRNINLAFTGTHGSGQTTTSKVNLLITQQADNALLAKFIK